MTRGYFAIIEKNKVVECGYLSSSAYPSYYGLLILEAIEGSNESAFIQTLREESDEDCCDKEITVDWFVRRPGDKESSRYEFPEYSYLLQRNSGILSIYNFGRLLYRIHPEEIPVYRFIFQNDYYLERALSIDPETNIETKDGTVELNRLIKCRPSKELLENIIARAPSVSVPKKSELRTVNESLWSDRTLKTCELNVCVSGIDDSRELDCSSRIYRNVSLEFREDMTTPGAYYATLRAANSFREDIPRGGHSARTKLSLSRAFAQSAEYVKNNQDDIVRLAIADRLFLRAKQAIESTTKSDTEAVAAGKQVIREIHDLCKGHASGIGDFERVLCATLQRYIDHRLEKGGSKE